MEKKALWRSIAICTVVAAIACVLLCMVVGALVARQVIPESTIGPIGSGITVFCTAMAAYLTGVRQGSKLMLSCLCGGCAFILVCVAVKAMLFGSWEQMSLPMVAVCVAGSALVSLCPMGKRKHRRRS